jgi:hypothetical protein
LERRQAHFAEALRAPGVSRMLDLGTAGSSNAAAAGTMWTAKQLFRTAACEHVGIVRVDLLQF